MSFGLIWMAFSFLVGFLGRNRAFGFWGWFFYALLASPLFAFIMLLLAADKERDQERSRAEPPAPTPSA